VDVLHIAMYFGAPRLVALAEAALASLLRAEPSADFGERGDTFIDTTPMCRFSGVCVQRNYDSCCSMVDNNRARSCATDSPIAMNEEFSEWLLTLHTDPVEAAPALLALADDNGLATLAVAAADFCVHAHAQASSPASRTYQHDPHQLSTASNSSVCQQGAQLSHDNRLVTDSLLHCCRCHIRRVMHHYRNGRQTSSLPRRAQHWLSSNRLCRCAHHSTFCLLLRQLLAALRYSD
jgi:hypothetical protein